MMTILLSILRPMLNDENTGASEELSVVSQPGGVSDPSDINWIPMIGLNTRNGH